MRTSNGSTRGLNLVDRYTNEPPYSYYNNNGSNKPLTPDSIALTTVFGLLIVLGVGSFAGVITFNNPSIGFLFSAGAGIALIAMWAVLFFKKQIKYPKTVFLIFSVLEGLILGALTSTIGNQTFGNTPGWTIVGQAVMGTVIIFGLSLFLYSQKIIRFAEYSRARRILYMVIGGFGLLYIVNFGITLVTGNSFLWGNGIFPIIIAAVAIVVASLSIIDDFGSIHRSIERGEDDKNKWLLSMALLSGIIWVYIELLRLLSLLARR